MSQMVDASEQLLEDKGQLEQEYQTTIVKVSPEDLDRVFEKAEVCAMVAKL